MTTEDFKRKLTAILSADVVGYSRLMGEDESATVKTLETYKGVMFSLIKQHRGRVVDSPGDNLLAEFGSVVDAVQCAVSIQKELQTRNAELPENRKMEFRIGINLGDVIEEEDRIYGDGVNIAARLEALADPGGICISKTAFDYIENKLPFGYRFIGEQTVKNIAKPIGAYKVLMETRLIDEEEQKAKAPFWRTKSALSLGIIVILAIGAALYWNFYLHGPSIEPASIDRMAYPLPDKPSIAVLPFDNLSGDPEQDYIGDGLSENIISALSVSSGIFVIARNSTFTYKGKPVKVQQVSEDLGVQYVLEGSIQKSGDQLKVTARIIDALSGHHLWSEVYNREMKELFQLLDEITKKITVSIGVELIGGESLRVVTESTDNLEAWKYFAKGAPLMRGGIRMEENTKAQEYLETALKHDPKYVGAMTALAATHAIDVTNGWSDSPLASMNRAFELLQKAVELDEQDPYPHAVLGVFYRVQKQHELAITEGKRAIDLNPNFAIGHMLLADTMCYSGRFDEAITLVKSAYRLDPIMMHRMNFTSLAKSLIFLGRYEEALEALEQIEENAQKAYLSAWVYQELGKEEEARAHMAKALEMTPGLSLETIKMSLPYKNPAHLQRELDAYRKAGMPERAPGAVQEKPSIAVLPFENLSSDKEQEYFSDGLSEELINKLSQVKDLQVTARTSSFYFKGKNEDMRIIGEKLGVSYLLEGSVQKSENQLRITAQLIKAEDGYHLFSKTYDRELKDIFAIQDDIAKAVTTALSITLGVGEFNRPGMTRNIEAYDLYLLASTNLLKSTPDSIQAAIDQIKRALDIDPSFYSAWIMLSKAYDQGAFIISPEHSVNFSAKAAEALKHVQTIEPNIPEVLMRTGFAHLNNGDWIEADRIFEKILNEQGHASSNVNMYYGAMKMFSGRSNEALIYLQRAKRLNPMDPSVSYLLSLALINSKRIEDAIKVDYVDYDNLIKILIELEKNNRHRAAAAIKDNYSLEGDDPNLTMLKLAAILMMEDSSVALTELHKLSRDSGIPPKTRIYMAHIASVLEDPELAFESIRDAAPNKDELLAVWHPMHKGIRQLPAFKSWIREIGLYDYWRESGEWPDLCRPVGDDDFVCE